MNQKIHFPPGILNKFSNYKILVVGDLMLDKFIQGEVSRISPEAPVPVVKIKSEKNVPGAAGNVALNLAGLGAGVYIASAVGDDFYGSRLLEILNESGCDISCLITDTERPTIVKTRIIAEHQQVVRTDLEKDGEISEKSANEISSKINSVFDNVNGVIISDYGKGLVTRKLIRKILKLSAKKDIPVVVDPQVGHFFEYRGVSALTPNKKEAEEALKTKITSEKELVEAGKKLLEKLKCRALVITRGEEGMSVFEKGRKVYHIQTAAREVYDVTGAGDTVAGIFTLGIVSSLSIKQAAQLANYAAASAVSKLGTAQVTKKEIEKEMKQ